MIVANHYRSFYTGKLFSNQTTHFIHHTYVVDIIILYTDKLVDENDTDFLVLPETK